MTKKDENSKELENIIKELKLNISDEEKNEIQKELENQKFGYPFNKHTFVLSYLLGNKKIDFNKYQEIKQKYLDKNKYINLFEIAGQSFGTYMEDEIRKLLGTGKPSNEIDIRYKKKQTYDAYIDYKTEIIRIEIKSSRFTKKIDDKTISFVSKAMYKKDVDNFWMNFQQLKPDISDIFVFCAVYRDDILYWVISSNEIKNNEKISNQHGELGGEYQLHIREDYIEEFNKKYGTNFDNLKDKIIEAYKRQTKSLNK